MVIKMKKNFKTVKSALIAGILIMSITAVLAPSASAGIFLDCQSVAQINFVRTNGELGEPIVPRGAFRTLDIEVRYWVTRNTFFGKGVLLAYSGKNAFVRLEIVGCSDWISATLGTDQVPLKVSEQVQRGTAQISIQADEDAPAYAKGYVSIKVSVPKIGLIQGFDQTFTLDVQAFYKPLITPHLPATNTMKIGPMDTAVFPVEVENMGNARTVVFLEVTYVPKGWNAIITSQVTLDEAEGSKATAYLVVKPPKDFGYHSEEETIKISMTPVRWDDFNDTGTTTYETFLVESQGFSTYGFEAMIPYILVLIVVITLVMYWFKKRKQ